MCARARAQKHTFSFSYPFPRGCVCVLVILKLDTAKFPMEFDKSTNFRTLSSETVI